MPIWRKLWILGAWLNVHIKRTLRKIPKKDYSFAKTLQSFSVIKTKFRILQTSTFVVRKLSFEPLSKISMQERHRLHLPVIYKMEFIQTYTETISQ